jgi:hypothetical protein
MNKFESFSVEDIRKIRTRESKKMIAMSAEEFLEYIRAGADHVREEMEAYREEKARAAVVDQAKEA